MRADECMSSPAVTVVPETTIVDAGRLMLERNVTALPVVDARGKVAGIVSRSDLVQTALSPIPART